MKHGFWVVVACAWLIGCQAPGERLAPPGGPVSEAEQMERDLAYAQGLSRVRVKVNYEGTRLINVIDQLREQTGQDCFVNWPALEAVGVEADAATSMQVARGTLPQVLDLVLQQVGAVAELDPIGWEVRNGVIHISTVRDLRKRTVLLIYDIRDLLFSHSDYSRADGVDAGIDLVQDNVGPPDQSGNQNATISELNGNLIVKTTAHNHQQLRWLLAQLRE